MTPISAPPGRVPQVASSSSGTLPSEDTFVVGGKGRTLTMVTEQDCRMALDRIVERVGEVESEQFEKHVVERTIRCSVPDLGLVFRSRIHAGGLDPFTPGDDRRADQVRVTVNSEDLVALAKDELKVARAWATGRLKIEASIFDLFRLRRLL